MFAFLKSEGDPQKRKKTILLLVAGALGILLLLLGGMSFDKTEAPGESVYEPQQDEVVIYQAYLEKEMKSLCEEVAGVKNVTVAVTLAGGFESVYATEERNGDEEYVILGSGSSAKALYLTRYAPDIVGVGIVCTGGGSQTVQNRLIPLLSTAFGISSNRIYVAEAGK